MDDERGEDHDEQDDDKEGDDRTFGFLGLLLLWFILGNMECKRLDLECFLLGFLSMELE